MGLETEMEMEFGKEKYNEGSEEGEERGRYRDGETETGIFTFSSCSRSEGQTPVWSKKKKLKGKLKEMYVCRPYICGMWYVVCSIWYVCPSNERCKVFLYPCFVVIFKRERRTDVKEVENKQAERSAECVQPQARSSH